MTRADALRAYAPRRVVVDVVARGRPVRSTFDDAVEALAYADREADRGRAPIVTLVDVVGVVHPVEL